MNEGKLALGLKISFSLLLIHVDFASKLAAYCNWLTHNNVMVELILKLFVSLTRVLR
jgi:hypothetical protein